MHIETPGERSSELVAALADVWERSVRATHDFLAEDDIVGLRPEAESGIAGVERLTVAYDGGAPCRARRSSSCATCWRACCSHPTRCR